MPASGIPDAVTMAALFYLFLFPLFPPGAAADISRGSLLLPSLVWSAYLTVKFGFSWSDTHGFLHALWMAGWASFVVLDSRRWGPWIPAFLSAVVALASWAGLVPPDTVSVLHLLLEGITALWIPWVLTAGLKRSVCGKTLIIIASYIVFAVHAYSLRSADGGFVERLVIPVMLTLLVNTRGGADSAWAFLLRGTGGALFITAVFSVIWALSSSFMQFVGASVLVSLGITMVMALWDRVVMGLVEHVVTRRSELVRQIDSLEDHLRRHPMLEGSITSRVREVLSSLNRPQRWIIVLLRGGIPHHFASHEDMSLPSGQSLEELAHLQSATYRVPDSRLPDMLESWLERSGFDMLSVVHSGGDILALAAGGGDIPLSQGERRSLARLASVMGESMERSEYFGRMRNRERLAVVGQVAAGLAHEIRNPLAAIKGAAELMEEEGSEFASIVVEESLRLDRVLSSFLDYARPFDIVPRPGELNVVVDSAVMAVMPALRGIEIQTVIPPESVIVMLDPDRMRQVLINLLMNARDALSGRDGARIIVRLRSTAHDAVVEVEDNGPGISEEISHRIFMPFFSTREGGTGLGLALSQKLVSLHDGTLTFQSVPGRTVFRITVPLYAS